jgi:EAL domain-containing protein (putative c-di-GMP-specific phosphodiesterase class I)
MRLGGLRQWRAYYGALVAVRLGAHCLLDMHMKSVASWRPGVRNGLAGPSATSVLERDRLARFFPALLGLTVVAGVLEGIAAIVLSEPALATAAGSTSVFAFGVVVAGLRIRAGHPVQGRITIAVSLTIFGGLGALMIPGVGPAMALLPIVSVVLVLPDVSRDRLIPVFVATVGATVVTLILSELPHPRVPLGLTVGTLFQDGILVGVAVLLLAGVADFAMDARDSMRDLRDASERKLRASAERLAIVGSLRLLRTESSPEATAAAIASALGNLPLADVAVVLEETDGGLVVLAAAGDPGFPFPEGHRLPDARAAYMLDRSARGAWAEHWGDRPLPTPADDLLRQFGVKSQAYAPILAGADIVGLIGIITTRDEQAAYLVSDLPAVREFASVSAAILAPSLLARSRLRSARVRIAAVIADEAFHPVFQPIVELGTGQTVGFEALTRFTNGDRPDRLFADAARVGLGAELEAATLAAAMRDGARLPADAWLSVNASPTLLAEYRALAGLLADRTRPIVLEVTEHDIVTDYAPLHAALARLGPDVRVAVDDAGAGVANFGHLVELRPAIVKIDAGLIRGVNADVSRQAVIVGLVHFAAMSGALVLAEGIETSAEQETVQRLGVTLGQGYHLGRPAPVEDHVLFAPPESPIPKDPDHVDAARRQRWTNPERPKRAARQIVSRPRR